MYEIKQLRCYCFYFRCANALKYWPRARLCIYWGSALL